jgi:hypothetical protein
MCVEFYCSCRSLGYTWSAALVMNVVVLFSSSTGPYSFLWVVVLCGLLSLSARAHWGRHQMELLVLVVHQSVMPVLRLKMT